MCWSFPMNVEEEVEPDEHGGVQGMVLEHSDVDLVESRFMEQAQAEGAEETEKVEELRTME